MATTTTPNMGLTVPTVGSEVGPDYAEEINDDLSLLDAHDHTAGSGVPITPDGINISSDLPFNENDATGLRSVRFEPQASAINAADDLGCLYEDGVDLVYIDGNGNNIPITNNGGLAGTPGSIANLVSPASASYVAGNQSFVWQSAASTPANMDAGSIIIREVAASALGITLASPTSLAGAYQLTLPAALPASTKIATVTSAGLIGVAYDVDNSTLEVSSNALQIKDGGVTRPKLVSVGQQVSNSSSTFVTTSTSYVDVTNLAVTITTTGRPVIIMVQGDGGVSNSYFMTDIYNDGCSSAGSYFKLLKDATTIAELFYGFEGENGAFIADTYHAYLPSIHHLDTPTAGTYTYKLQVKCVSSGNPIQTSVIRCRLIAYEL